MSKIIKNKYFIIAAIIFVSLVFAFFYFSKSDKPNYDFVLVKKGGLIQEVSVTGRVKPAEEVNLAFEKSGKVSAVYVDIGNRVKSGSILATLDSGDIEAQLKQARAGLESAKAQLQQYQAALENQKAKLAELKRGTRQEDIAVKESEYKKSQQDLANYYSQVATILSDVHNKADDAVVRQTDEMFTNDSTGNPQLSFLVSDSQLKVDSEWQRFLAGVSVKNLKSEIDGLSSDYGGLDSTLVKTKEYLVVVNDFLIKLSDTVNSVAGLSQSTVNSYKSNINTGRTNVNDAISSIATQQQNIAAQKINVEKIKNELNKLLAGSSSEEIEAQAAQVKQAEANIISQQAKIVQEEANVANYQVQLKKMAIVSPVNGIITVQDAKVGEIITPNSSLISIISEKKFEIEANIPEADIAKVKIGNPAKVTLDAYGSDNIFEAKVVSVNPAGKIIEGVATYKTTLQFVSEDGRLKSEMTANIDILTAKLDNVIIVPQRSVIIRDGEKIVKILGSDGVSVKEIEVKTGLRGSSGIIEIIEGLSEDDRVIISLQEK